MNQRVITTDLQQYECVKRLEKLLKKNKKELEDFIVMDDYDGGERARLRQTIRELESILNK